MTTTRESGILVNGTLSLDIDPVMIENGGPFIGCAMDPALMDLHTAMMAYLDLVPDAKLSIVWTDNLAPVMVECCECDSIVHAASMTVLIDDDEPAMVCAGCASI